MIARLGRSLTAGMVFFRGAHAASLCMDVPDVGVDVNVQVWGCNGLSNQQIEVTSAGATTLASHKDGQTLCINAVSRMSGTEVMTGHCSPPGSSWVFDAGSWQIRAGVNDNLCLDAGDMQEGSQLFIWECNGLPQQQWGYDDEKQTIYLAQSRRLSQESNSTATVLV